MTVVDVAITTSHRDCLDTGIAGIPDMADRVAVANMLEERAPDVVLNCAGKTGRPTVDLLDGFPVLVIRPRMPFDDTLHPRSLIGKLVRYRRVLDEPNSLTYVPDLLEATLRLMNAGQVGTFNVANPGLMSPFEIMCRYQEIVDPSHTCEAISASSLDNEVVARRSNCQLSLDKLEGTGVHPRPLATAVDVALQAIRKQVT